MLPQTFLDRYSQKGKHQILLPGIFKTTLKWAAGPIALITLQSCSSDVQFGVIPPGWGQAL